MKGVRSSASAPILVLALVSWGQAQTGPALNAAGQLEREGKFPQAAARYQQVLAGDPSNVPALLGLERVLERGGHLGELVPFVHAALQRDSLNHSIRTLELRTWFALGREDSAEAAVHRWTAAEPTLPDPYREWAFLLAAQGNMAAAREVLADGAERLGDNSLAQELAQASSVAGEWREAARQWVAVLQQDTKLLSSASANLSRSPPAARETILSTLLGARSDSTSRLLASDLLVSWGRASEGWPLLDASLPADPPTALALLQRFVERSRSSRGREAALARAYALERMMPLTPPGGADRARVLAAQAYAEAGSLDAAQHMLGGVAASGTRAPVEPAMTSLIRALAEEGKVEEAERRYKEWSGRLSVDDRESLDESIAWAWLRRGDIERADAALGADSGVSAMAVRGWVALYRGDIGAARELFGMAGPYVGTRAAATQRTTMLALLQRIQEEKLPSLGQAMLALARGDTARALDGLDDVARRVPAAGGRADVLALAGEIAADHREWDRASQLLEAAMAVDSLGPVAPAAEFSLAHVQADQGHQQLAIQRLEHLILRHPESAVVPQARRLLDQLKGAIPE